MKARITLNTIRNTNPPVYHPYWFTNDGTIHLNAENPSLEVDLETTSKENLIRIHNACLRTRVITCNNLKGLEAAINPKVEKPVEEAPAIEPVKEDVVQSEPEVVEEVVKEIDPIIEEIEKTLQLPVKKLRPVIGLAGLTDKGELQYGINDAAYLHKMIEVEQSKEEVRKSVIMICEDRIKAIQESNGFMVEEAELGEITPENLLKAAR